MSCFAVREILKTRDGYMYNKMGSFAKQLTRMQLTMTKSSEQESNKKHTTHSPVGAKEFK